MHGYWMRRPHTAQRTTWHLVLWALLIGATAGLGGCLGGDGDEPAGHDTMTWPKTDSDFGTLQAGTYSATASEMMVNFLESTDPDMPPGTYTFDYTMNGDSLTFVDATGPDDMFGRCEYGPSHGIEGNWTNLDGHFNLVIYGEEFAAVGSEMAPQ